jgi:uncharacterized protein (TIGR03067 family)
MPSPQTVLSIAVLLLTTLPSRADDAPKGDLKKLQGKWTTKVGIDKNIDVVLEFKGQAATGKVTTADGQEFELKGEIVVNDEAKPHKTIDWVKFTGPDGQSIADNLGIYNFESDDEVTVCNGGPGNARPTEFKAGESGDPQVVSLKREKAAKDEAKGDLAKLQGGWTAKVGPNEDLDLLMTVTGNEVSLSMARDGEERSFQGKVELDEAAKPHPAITFKGFTRPDGTDAPENLGIYVFEGNDTIKVCTGGPGNARPTEIKAGEGGPPILITLKRKPK